MSIYTLLELLNDARSVANGDVGKRMVRRVTWRFGVRWIRRVVAFFGATR